MIPSALSLAPAFSYPALIIGTIIAQPAAALGGGALAASGVTPLLLVFLTIFCTDIVMDCVWYGLGRQHGERVARFLTRMLRITEAHIARIHDQFHTRPALILVSAKLLGGFGIMPFILFTAGTSRMPFGRYLLFNVLGEVLWSGGLLSFGYFFSFAIGNAEGLIGKVSFIGLFAAIVGIFIFITHRLARRFLD